MNVNNELNENKTSQHKREPLVIHPPPLEKEINHMWHHIGEPKHQQKLVHDRMNKDL